MPASPGQLPLESPVQVVRLKVRSGVTFATDE
jgi:hypothetical protein